MRIEAQAFVTVLEVNGNWQEKLWRLSGPYQPSTLAIQRISTFVSKNPLQRKSAAQPKWREYAPGKVDDTTEFIYTNHHWFPVLWLIRRFNRQVLDIADSEVMTEAALREFYLKGLEHYHKGHVLPSVEAEVLSGVMTTNYMRIVGPMPDILLNIFYPEFRYRWE